jgi:hypothetical protein
MTAASINASSTTSSAMKAMAALLASAGLMAASRIA